VAISAGDAEAISAGDVVAISAGDAEAISVGDAEAISAGDVVAISAGDAEAISVGDVVAISAGDAEAISAGDVVAISAGDAEAISVGDVVAISAGDVVAISAGDAEAISAGDVVAISAGDTDASSTAENAAMSVRESEEASRVFSFESFGEELDALSDRENEALVESGAALVLAGSIESVDYLSGRVSLLGIDVFVPLSAAESLVVGDYVGLLGEAHSATTIEVYFVGIYRTKYLEGTSVVVRAFPAAQLPAKYADAPHFGKSSIAATTIVYGVVRGNSDTIRNAYLVSK
ncbi:MAG: hypothetical protein AAFN07_12245, partial [Pseudomonadota bacterium]